MSQSQFSADGVDDAVDTARSEVMQNPWRIALASAVVVWLVVGGIIAISSKSIEPLGMTAIWALLGGLVTGAIGTKRPLPTWAYPVLVLVIAIVLVLLWAAIAG
jgi:hypothetical protein